MRNTFFCVSIWVGRCLVLFPLRYHLGPFPAEILGSNSIKLPLNSEVFFLHCESLNQASEKLVALDFSVSEQKDT